MSARKRVVVTGMGAVTPIGNSVAEFWDALKSGTSGIATITRFDATGCAATIAAEIKNLNYEDHFEKKEVRKVEDFTKNSIIASRQAAADSGILESGLSRDEIGCLMGVGIGGIPFIQECCITTHIKGPSRVSPMFVPRTIANISPGMIAIDLQLKGPSYALVSACAAGTHALGEAAYMIERGDAVAMLAGGSEAAVCQVAIAGFGNMTALATNFNDNPSAASRPFDAQRSGFVLGEGSGVLLLEDYDHAKARGAKIYAELIGYGLSTDAHHITAPSPEGEGSARAMNMALRRAGLKPADIGYINAHGTSTPLNDKYETMAIKKVFGEHAYKLAVSSNKSMIGHLLGAAGAVEAVASVMTLRDGILPPTINYTTPDPDCDLDYVPNVAREQAVNYVMSNSLGFGGHNCSVIFSKGA